MASANYVLLERITVGAAGASSVTFSGIPQTGYTDLVVKFSGRNTDTGGSITRLQFNGDSATNYSVKALTGNGATATSYSAASQSYVTYIALNCASETANTFGNAEIYIPNYTSSNQKSVSVDSISENNAATAYVFMDAGLWTGTSAITSITLLNPGSTTFTQYSTFYLYGVAKLGTTPAIVPYATGGDTIMTDGTYWYHAFKASGTFTPAKGLSCDVLVVAGGGGGAGGNAGGGGGGGGVRYLTSQSSASGTGYTVTIGAGGAAGAMGANGSVGAASSFNALSADGGGFGGKGFSPGGAGGNGGSGGGGGGNAAGTQWAGGTATSGQGNTGGSGTFNGLVNNTTGGGGGGAGAVGASGGNNTAGGNGGAGTGTYSSWGSVTGTGENGSGTFYFAGGGGGGFWSATGQSTSGGIGGGKGGSNGTGADGLANTGGGAGGGGTAGGNSPGGAGGSGLVIVRYAV